MSNMKPVTNPYPKNVHGLLATSLDRNRGPLNVVYVLPSTYPRYARLESKLTTWVAFSTVMSRE